MYNWFEMEMVSERVDFKSQMLGTVFFPIGNIFESTIKQLLVRFLSGMENCRSQRMLPASPESEIEN